MPAPASPEAKDIKTPALAGLGLLALAACSPATNAPPSAPQVGLANPASVYCIDQGGTLEPVTTAAGISNTCVLPDGERIDEWDLYRRDHKS